MSFFITQKIQLKKSLSVLSVLLVHTQQLPCLLQRHNNLFNEEPDHSAALRRINTFTGLHTGNRTAFRLDSGTLRPVVKKHGVVQGMVIQLLCFDRFLVLLLATGCGVVPRGVTESLSHWVTPEWKLPLLVIT